MTAPTLAVLARRGTAAGDAVRAENTACVSATALLVADTLACLSVGGDHPTLQRLLDLPHFAGEGSACRPLASPRSTLPLADALVVDATAAHLDEFDVVHPPSGTVPGAVTVPAALHLGALGDVAGPVFLGAVAAGVEVTAVSGLLLGGAGLYSRSWWPGAVAGRIGAAMAASYVLGLDHTRTTHALALAAASAGGLLSEDVFADGHYLLLGDAASLGVQGARRAAVGLRGAVTLLDGPARRAFRSEAEPVDERPRHAVLECLPKEFPCATPLQAVIRGLESLGGRAVVAEAVALEVAMPAPMLAFVSCERTVDGPPEAAASLAHVVGAVACDRPRDVTFYRAADAARAYPGELGLVAWDREDAVEVRVVRSDGARVRRTEGLRSPLASREIVERKRTALFPSQSSGHTVPDELAAGLRPRALLQWELGEIGAANAAAARVG